MSAARELTIVMADPGFEGPVPSGPKTSVLPLEAVESIDVKRGKSYYFVFTSASGLELVAQLVHAANSVHRLRALFVRADVECTWFIPMFERANLRTLRNTLVHTDPAVPRRVINAWQMGAQNQLIADATVSDDRLFVRNCALDSFEVSFGDVPALARIPESERTGFVIDADGSYLYWDASDTHVGLEIIRFAIDPAFRETTLLSKLAFDRRFGRAVRAIREETGLRQTDISGLSPRQVSRIEAGSVTPRHETLRKIAAAHSLTVSDYLDSVAEHIAVLPPA
ncbi:MAG: helix-turn-helix transcriptional regulator [Coriobacteriia bacterium]|nr:helix-turn-helix transcriptional regulator [Coriobacteriia bacterium]